MPPPPEDPLDWIRLYRSENVGPSLFFRLLDRYGSAKSALDALPDLAARGGRKKISIPSPAAAEAELQALDRLGGRLLLAADAEFPAELKALEVTPLLSLLGDASWLNRPAIAIVGAREASLAGCKIAHRMARDLGRAGYCIVSGLARGIDSAAHQGALGSGTVAVLAGGVDIVYPPENLSLYRQIIEQGCMISELPPGTRPQAQLFPRRNRLISGLAQGVVVVEAKIRSGSLVTARLALEQGREVFAVPGSPLEPRAEGPNRLIKQGAILTESAQDVLDGLGFLPARPIAKPAPAAGPPELDSLPAAQAWILRHLTVTAVSVDEILRQCQFSPATLSLVLLELELAGRLQRHPDQTVSLRA